MTGILQALLGSVSSAVAVVTDAYFNLVTLLLPGNGTNGAQNNTFLDSSSNNFTITRNGNTTQGTFSPFSQTGWGNFFFGQVGVANGSLSATHPAMSANWTIEAWIYRTSGGVNQCITLLNNGGFSGILVYISSSNYLTVNDGVNAVGSFTNVSVPINTWTHIAAVRSGGTTTGYVNGVVAGSNTFTPATVSSIRIGEYFSGDFMFFPGYMSNFRVVNGTAVYTGAFTPPTTPLTNITNTSLLTCQSNRFVDNGTANSGSGFTITVNGNVSVQAFSPFAPTAAYSAATVGGSGYFDGTGDYLSVASNPAFQLGTGDWTVEYFVYPTTFSNSPTMVDTRASTGGNGYADYFNTSGKYLLFWSNANQYTSAATFVTNTWYHIAVCRASGTVSVYINGNRDGTFSSSTNLSDSNLRIGNNEGASAGITGYLSSVRIVKGTAVYSGTTITVPTAPLTSITNTSILTNFTNAGITDATAKNDLETVGNAQISTTQSKFGGSSMYFDGAGDYLQYPDSPLWNFGSSDFTIEFWVYPTSFPNYATIISKRVNNAAITPFDVIILSSGKLLVESWNSGTAVQITSNGTFTLNVWTHVAVVRSGTSLRMYFNGTADSVTGTYASGATLTVNTTPVTIGQDGATASSNFAGYLDDFRITRYARYTTNFTAPTAAFALQ